MKLMNNPTSIGFASNLVPLILNGTKTLTYRKGDSHDFLNAGDDIDVRDSTTGKIFARVEITDKSYITFGKLPIDKKGHEVYSSKKQQKEIFTSYYGKIADKDKMIVLEFKVLKVYG